MGLIQAAVLLSNEAPIDNPSVPAWAFGGFAFLALSGLLVFVMMIKVGR